MESLNRLSKIAIIIVALLMVGFLGVTDFLTGAYLSFSIFYLIPILMASWAAGRFAGIFMSLAAAAAWLVCDSLSGIKYPQFLILYWNAFVRLCFFVISAYLLSSLRDSLEKEKELSNLDPLTGLENSRAFFKHAEMEIERIRRSRRPFSVAYIDIDDFKKINDTKGHSTGDSLLGLVADLIRNDIRKIDVAARLGGDEFAVLLPETDEKSAFDTIERVQKILLDAMKRNDWPVTFSIGIATFSHPPNSVNDMIRTADSIMYTAKRGGKNMIKNGLY